MSRKILCRAFQVSHLRFILIILASLFIAMPLLAVTTGIQANVSMDWLKMGMGLFGGLALFLFGMEQMADALKAVAGERMKDILARLTKNRVTAAITGAFVTAVIQSSSVTTVLVVGFISAGVMTMTQSIGIIMGANVGTTITAQIVAFKVTEVALLMVAVGFGMLFFSNGDRFRQYGGMTMGLGMVFFGMSIMSDAMTPLRSFEPFLDLMSKMENPLFSMLVAGVFTALVQSSSATTGIVVVMASQGFITLPAGIAMALGANIGTCVTAVLAAIGKPIEAIRASMVHVLFNVLGAVLWIAFINNLAELATWMSPVHSNLSGIERLAAETPRQIANANTAFNLINTMLFLPLAGLFASLVVKLLPEKPVKEKVIIRPKFLDKALVETPSLALEQVRLELGHMGELVLAMLEEARNAMVHRDRSRLEPIAKRDDQLDVLQDLILEYLGQIQKSSLAETESTDMQQLLSASDYLESIGDIIGVDIVPLGLRVLESDSSQTSTINVMLDELYDAVKQALKEAINAVRNNDERMGQEVLAAKSEIEHLVDSVLQHQADQLKFLKHRDIEVFRLDMEVLEKLRRLYTMAKRMARTVLPKTVSAKSE